MAAESENEIIIRTAGSVALAAASLLVLNNLMNQSVHRLAELAVTLCNSDKLLDKYKGLGPEELVEYLCEETVKTLNDLDSVGAELAGMRTSLQAAVATLQKRLQDNTSS